MSMLCHLMSVKRAKREKTGTITLSRDSSPLNLAEVQAGMNADTLFRCYCSLYWSLLLLLGWSSFLKSYYIYSFCFPSPLFVLRAAPVNAAVTKGLDVVVGVKRPFSFTSSGGGSSSTAAPPKLTVLEKMELEKKRKRQKVGEKESGGGVAISASRGEGGRSSSTSAVAPKPSALSSFFTTLQGGAK
jgi:hypothetical protein